MHALQAGWDLVVQELQRVGGFGAAEEVEATLICPESYTDALKLKFLPIS